MDNEQIFQRLAKYMCANLGMLPRTADMAAKRYVRQYLDEMQKKEMMPEDLPDLGAWLAAKFLTLEIIDKDSVNKLISDFKTQMI